MNAKTTKALSGGQAAVEALRNEKTEYVFGLIGSATMEIFDALYLSLIHISEPTRRS